MSAHLQKVCDSFTGSRVHVYADSALEHPLVDVGSSVLELPLVFEQRAESLLSLRGQFSQPLLSGELAHCAGYFRLEAPWWASEAQKLEGATWAYLGFIESLRADLQQKEARVVDTGFLGRRTQERFPHLPPALQKTLLLFFENQPAFIRELSEPETEPWVERAFYAYQDENWEGLTRELDGVEIEKPVLYFDPRFWLPSTLSPGVSLKGEAGGGETSKETQEAQGNLETSPVLRLETLENTSTIEEEAETPEEEASELEAPNETRASDTEDTSSPDSEQKEAIEEQDLLAEIESMPEFKQLQYEAKELEASQKKERETRANLTQEASKASREVFKKTPPKYSSRRPTQLDQKLLKATTKAFKKARIRAPQTTIVKSSSPPGRLDTRAAVAGVAQESMGLPVTAQPFRATVKKKVEGPPPAIGLMLDISGSMKNSVQPMSSLAWALAHSSPKVKGTFSAVTFGNQVYPLMRSGQKPPSPINFRANDSAEKSSEAILALTGHLPFFNQNLVRVLIISSDMLFSAQEKRKTVELMGQLRKLGVKILVVPYRDTPAGKGWWDEHAETVSISNLESLPMEISKTITQALKDA